MVSFLVVAKSKKNRQEYIAKFCKEKNIHPFDVTIVGKLEEKQSIGIEDVLMMQKKLFLKPIRSETKAVVLEDAEVLTVEAQTALLKVLEEPPDHTLILLSTQSQEPLLPTILSRCQIMQLKGELPKLTEKEKEEFLALVNRLQSVGEALKLAEKLSKDKEKAIEWVEKLILVLREQVLTHYSPSPFKGEGGEGEKANESKNADFLRIIASLQVLHTLLKTTNVNPRFAIENTLLSL